MLNEGPIALPYILTPSPPHDVYTVREADDLRVVSSDIGLADTTIVAEFKIDEGGLPRRILNLPVKPDVDTWTDILMHLSPTGTLKFRRGGDVLSSTITDYDPYLGIFNTAVLTYSDNYVKGYFNGGSVLTEVDGVDEFIDSHSQVYIGTDSAAGAWLNGNMRSVEFYDDAMTAAEVSSL